MRYLKSFVAAAVVWVGGLHASSVAACTIVKEDAFAAYWRGPGAPQPRHPLWGQVLFDGQLVRPETQACETSPLQVLARELTAAALDGQIILLGEVHDNGEHHKLRGELVRQINAGVKASDPEARVPLVFEHIRSDQQSGLDQFNTFNAEARRLGTASDLFRFLDWPKSGWPDQRLFAPLFEAAIQTKSPIVAGDPSRTSISAVARRGLGSLDPETLRTLHLDAPLAPSLQAALTTELVDSHCGMMTKETMGSMVDAQRYHDAYLAAAAFKAAADHGSAIVLTGNGHVRSDRGVPLYLRKMAPSKNTVTVVFVETEVGKLDPNGYAPTTPDSKAAADYVVFTPAATREDPCEKMRAMMRKKT
jgi:uncharacterized iron-regulated protein